MQKIKLPAAKLSWESTGGGDRLIFSIEGPERSGRSHFCATMPGPIAYIGIGDIGCERILRKFRAAGKKIAFSFHRVHVPPEIARIEGGKGAGMVMDEEAVRQIANQVWLDILAATHEVIESKSKFRSLVFDTATELWEVLRLARFGRGLQVTQNRYPPVNSEFSSFINQFTEYDLNVGFIHKTTEEYQDYIDQRSGEKKSRATGRMKRKGFNGLQYLVEAQFKTAWNDKDKGFEVTVLDAGEAPELRGVTIPDADFPLLAGMILPHADASRWE